MEIHPPAGKLHGVKDYLVHLSMIVLGILIALGLEGWREARHHQELVRRSIEAMRAEVQTNKKLLEQALGGYQRSRPLLARELARIEAAAQARRAGRSGTHFAEGRGDRLEVELPLLYAGAWQAALSSQAFSYMDFEQARRWSSVYAQQAQVIAFHNEWISFYGKLVPLTKVSDQSDLDHLQEAARLAEEIQFRMLIVEGNWKDLLRHYDEVLGGTSGGVD